MQVGSNIILIFIIGIIEYTLYMILSKIEKRLFSEFKKEKTKVYIKNDYIHVFFIKIKSLVLIKIIKYVTILSTLFCYTLDFLFFGNIRINPYISVFGLFIMSIGYGLRIIAIKTLKEFWSYRIELKSNHKIVNRGIYKYIKHPAYIGNIYFLGIYLIFNPDPFQNNILTFIYFSFFAIIIILITKFYKDRTKLENKLLNSLKDEGMFSRRSL